MLSGEKRCRRGCTPGGFVTDDVSRDPPADLPADRQRFQMLDPMVTKTIETRTRTIIDREEEFADSFHRTRTLHALISTAYRDAPRLTTSSHSSTKLVGSHEWLRRRLRACERCRSVVTIVDLGCARRVDVVCSLLSRGFPL